MVVFRCGLLEKYSPEYIIHANAHYTIISTIPYLRVCHLLCHLALFQHLFLLSPSICSSQHHFIKLLAAPHGRGPEHLAPWLRRMFSKQRFFRVINSKEWRCKDH